MNTIDFLTEGRPEKDQEQLQRDAYMFANGWAAATYEVRRALAKGTIDAWLDEHAGLVEEFIPDDIEEKLGR